ncbi:MAG: hypothetical protein ABI364_09435, partial [Caldimonas sp.]
MSIEVVYVAWALASLVVFRLCRPALAVLIAFLGGWILLPVGVYPADASTVPFPYWIVGLALPSDMLLTKAWVAPAAAFLGVLVFDRPALRTFRPTWLDAPIVLWCLWPIAAAAFAAGPARPPALVASLYLAGSWGLPWLLGRLYFARPPGQMLLLAGLAVSSLACLPFSLIEGVMGPTVYGWFYEPHPFRFDGAERYVGFRPIGFFEHGNQFGLWIALSALAAVWLALAAPHARRARWAGVAAVLVTMSLAAQSAGAFFLLLLGAAAL